MIAPADVNNRLQSDIPDAVLNGNAMIPMAEAWAATLLVKNGKVLSNLTTAEQTLLDGAKIAFVALRVVSDKVLEGFDIGVVKGKGVSAKEKQEMVKIFKDEIKKLLSMIGLYSEKWYSGSSTSDDYNLYDYSYEDKARNDLWLYP